MAGFLQDLTRTIAAKTADYQVTKDDLGKMLTTRGTSAQVNFTLPTVGTVWSGWWVEFFNAAGQTMAILSSGSLDNISTFNDLTADSITFSTSSELIGASVKVTWDGTGWLSQLMTEETQTSTIA